MKRVTLAFLLTVSSVCAARAAVIDYIDTSATPFVTIDGTTVTGNGGLVSNYTVGPGELIAFTFQSTLVAGFTGSGYANLLEPGSSTVSDRVILSITQGSTLVGVQFGSDANLPAIPSSGASDVGDQVENGSLQLLITYVDRSNNNAVVDSYYIQSIAPTPVPAALPLFATGLGGLGLLRWRRKRKAQAV